jgi:hypothetical protein
VEDPNMLRSAVALVMTLVPGVAAAEMAVDVHLRTPAVRVSVATGPVYQNAPAEMQPPAPSPHHVWIAGAWGNQDGRRVWVPGRWVMPPGPDYVWEPARWVDQGGNMVFYEGHWRQLPPTVVYQPEPVYAQPVYVEAAPPPPIVEIRPAAPLMNAVWIPGYWRWHDRRHHWVKGRWSAPRPGYVWVSDRWDRHDRRWAYQAGHWQRDNDHRGGWDRRDHDRRDRNDRRDRDDDHRGRGNRHGHHKHNHR